MRDALFISAALALASIAGPLSLVSAQAGVADPQDIYLVVALDGQAELPAELGAQGLLPYGPVRGFLGRFVIAPPDAHASLKNAGFLVFPAGKLAAICGSGGLERRS